MAESREVPWLRIFAEGGAIVVSILLAFAIDAAWDDREEQQEERRLLESLLNELRTNQEKIVEMTRFQKDIEAATLELLQAAASTEETLSDGTVDQLLADQSWYNGNETFECPLSILL